MLPFIENLLTIFFTKMLKTMIKQYILDCFEEIWFTRSIWSNNNIVLWTEQDYDENREGKEYQT